MDYQKYISSDYATKHNIDNTPNEDTENRCKLFLLNAVEPLEALFYPKKIVFHSGYRCPELNTALKGNEHSEHMKANAIDFNVEWVSLPDTYRIIKNSSLKFNQLILEGKVGHQWCHLSYNTDLLPSKQRMQALEIPNP